MLARLPQSSAAEADGYRKLGETIQGLRLRGGRGVVVHGLTPGTSLEASRADPGV